MQTIEIKNDYLKVVLTDIGASIVELWVRDKHENWTDVVLGYSKVSMYQEERSEYFGACIVPNANRIGQMPVDFMGLTIDLEKNEGENNLHSGTNGLYRKKWEILSQTNDSITFSICKPRREYEFPGEMLIKVNYQLDGPSLLMTISGETDENTVFNPTNHSYFNLNGHSSGSILDHQLCIHGNLYLPIDGSLNLPESPAHKVFNTPFDFTTPSVIREKMVKGDTQINIAKGYDHCYLLNESPDILKYVARIIGNESQISLTIKSTLPAVQFYTGNHLSNAPGKEGVVYEAHDGFCLETQLPPNLLDNRSLLKSGEIKCYQTIYSFR